MTEGTLTVELTIDTSRFDAAIERVQRTIERVQLLRWRAELSSERQEHDCSLAAASGLTEWR